MITDNGIDLGKLELFLIVLGVIGTIITLTFKYNAFSLESRISALEERCK